MQPQVECCETSAERFFNHPAVRGRNPGGFLIPYFSEYARSAHSHSPFLKFGYKEWIELSGQPDSETPVIRSTGALIERILNSLSEDVLKIECALEETTEDCLKL